MALTPWDQTPWGRLQERARLSKTARVGQRQLRAADAQLPAQRLRRVQPHTCGQMPLRSLGARLGGRVCSASLPLPGELVSKQGADAATSSGNRAWRQVCQSLCTSCLEPL